MSAVGSTADKMGAGGEDAGEEPGREKKKNAWEHLMLKLEST